ncbi:MAG: RNA 2',3'-cyclic phosphodiesterase [Proteobacteria bacterium]|nr:RNA 2',3'-cyclic phosphodiesterase [Pseudomonadota bacterium]
MDADSVRIFFALWPANAERGALVDWQCTLEDVCGGRVMRADTLHATLVFIGEIEAARLEALKLAAAEVVAGCFDLCFDEARYWGHNHILYAAPNVVPQQLVQLVRELELHLTRHRFKFEQREFKPHVTLLRNARWTEDPLPKMPPVRWLIREFVLVQSVRGEANYRILANFSLK